jgi:acylaminoacyl-peptidase
LTGTARPAATEDIVPGTRRIIVPEDILNVETVRSVRLHPKAELGAVITQKPLDLKRYHTNLNWLHRVGEPQPSVERSLLSGVFELGWSPAGDRFHLVQVLNDAIQLLIGEWRTPDSLTQPSAVVPLAAEPDRITWSADGRRLCFAARVGASYNSDDGHIRFQGVVPFKRESIGYVDGAYWQVFLVELGSQESQQVCQLTNDPVDHRMAALSPDATIVAYVRPATGREGFLGKECLVLLDVASRAERTFQIGGQCWYPTWDARGERLAWLGHDSRMGATEATDTRLWVLEPRTRRLTCLSEPFKRSIEDVVLDDCTADGHKPIVWDEEHGAILAVASDGGRTSIWRFEAEGPFAGTRPPLNMVNGQRRVVAFDYARGQFLVAVSSPEDPCRALLFGEERELEVFAPNSSWLGQCEVSAPNRFEFAGAQDALIEGWIIPPNGRSIVDAPCVILMDRGHFGWTFYLEGQVLAAAGFAVAFVNPHGSYGYGEAFKASTHYDPATLEVEDILHAVHTLSQMGVDASRVGISGASFGGFLVNWLVTHHPDRFSVAVSQASYCNRHSLWGTSSIGPSRWDRPGAPWQHAEFLLSRSPLSYVDRVRVPLLLIHGDSDTICPLEQAEQWYTALTMSGKHASLLILTNEGHDLARSARPESRILRVRSIVDWFRTHLLKDTER